VSNPVFKTHVSNPVFVRVSLVDGLVDVKGSPERGCVCIPRQWPMR
jgi:hypothetical protein